LPKSNPSIHIVLPPLKLHIGVQPSYMSPLRPLTASLASQDRGTVLRLDCLRLDCRLGGGSMR
jgi:hypothetical protein